MLIPSYTTGSFEYFFYFPAAGEFSIYPANAAKAGVILASAAPRQFRVGLDRSRQELKTMSDVLEKGTKKDILDFVASKNILNPQLFAFEDILYLLKDR
jgi:hypothetical protein